MADMTLDALRAEIAADSAARPVARVRAAGGGLLRVTGSTRRWRLSDQVRILRDGADLWGEIVTIGDDGAGILPDAAAEGVKMGDAVVNEGPAAIRPHAGWIGRIVDPDGRALDGRPLMRGRIARGLRAAPPGAGERGRFGARLDTGWCALNTLLPVVRGQRLGLFAGSGVGKSMLLGSLARRLRADVAVIALVGERGRELRDFVEDALGQDGMARSVVMTATSDRSALQRRRCAWAAMAVAESFRDEGRDVLFLCDSVTRFAEAHREVALAAGEPAAMRGFPPSTAHEIAALAERAGPGRAGAGAITAIFSVLVAGSDMDEPVADILRGVLDGHVVLSRDIAERGRFPAIDLPRSVSRSLPQAADDGENAVIAEARRLIGTYDQTALMIQSGLYVQGSDPGLDRAVRLWPALDGFLAQAEDGDVSDSFDRLRAILADAAAGPVADSAPAQA